MWLIPAIVYYHLMQEYKEITMPAGRPTVATLENIAKAVNYVNTEYKEEDELFPTVEGLALYLGISKDSLYERDEFSDVLGKLKLKQAKDLIRHGIKGEYSPVITKLLLSSKHGYVEKSAVDATTNGESLNKPNEELAAKFTAFLKKETEAK